MPTDRRVYRFDQFVFEPASGELKNGATITRLQPQTASLLTALLEQPGTVLSRAELQKRLWPDVTVDYDDGLNFCIRQLRLALGDDATSPRFVETLARRGYRFIAPVTAPSDEAVPAIAFSPVRVRRPVLIATVAIIIVVGLVVWAQLPAPPVRNSGTRLAVLPFLADTTDSLMVKYRRKLLDQLNAGVGGSTRPWSLVTDSSSANYVLSGALKRRGFSVELFVQLVRRPGRRHIWADSILDSYPFDGNSTLTADRIANSVTRLLQAEDSSVTK